LAGMRRLPVPPRRRSFLGTSRAPFAHGIGSLSCHNKGMTHTLIHGRFAAFQRRTGTDVRHGWVDNKLFKLHHKLAISALAGLLFLPSVSSSGRIMGPYSNLASQPLLHMKGKRVKAPLLAIGIGDWRSKQIALIEPSYMGQKVLNYDGFVMPVQSDLPIRISSPFGPRLHPVFHSDRFHKGLDIARPRGSLVVPARSGIVIYAGWAGSYGKVVEVRHPDGELSIYGHLGRTLVRRGQKVVRGETPLGLVGSTGLCTGPHLHFEVRDALGRPVDPTVKIGRR
jgi:hypothetical protein